MKYDVLNNKIMEMQDEIIAAIQQNMRIDSVKGEARPDAPYGEGPKAALMDALALGERLGFKTGVADNRVGWVEYGDGEEMVGVLGHLDVVPVGDDGWTYPPFGAEIHDGKLWGRGVLDDKGPIIGSIFALKAIRDLGLPIDRRIRVLFGTDEECGSSCVEYYVENGYEMPTIGFTPDGDFPLIFFEKGMTRFTVGGKVTDKGNIEVEYFGGGIAANVVTPTCKLIVKGNLKVTETEGVSVCVEDGKTTVEAVGLGAHGSMPELGVNAAVKLLNAVKENDFGGDFGRYMNFILEKIGTEVHGESFGINYVDEETGVTTLNLGVLNYDGEDMSLTLDVRYPKTAAADVVVPAVTKVAEAYGLEVLEADCTECLYVPQDSELVVKLMEVYKAETGRDDKPMAIGGGTYAKHFPNMVAFGPCFIEDPSVIHQPNECADIDKLMQAIQVFGAAMYELALK